MVDVGADLAPPDVGGVGEIGLEAGHLAQGDESLAFPQECGGSLSGEKVREVPRIIDGDGRGALPFRREVKAHPGNDSRGWLLEARRAGWPGTAEADTPLGGCD